MSVSLVGSTNWPDDYLYKLDEYEALGIRKYWIVDYLTVGAIRYISLPKPPPVSVYILISDEYQLQQFRGRDRILSITFPELAGTAAEIFEAVGFYSLATSYYLYLFRFPLDIAAHLPLDRLK